MESLIDRSVKISNTECYVSDPATNSEAQVYLGN